MEQIADLSGIAQLAGEDRQTLARQLIDGNSLACQTERALAITLAGMFVLTQRLTHLAASCDVAAGRLFDILFLLRRPGSCVTIEAEPALLVPATRRIQSESHANAVRATSGGTQALLILPAKVSRELRGGAESVKTQRIRKGGGEGGIKADWARIKTSETKVIGLTTTIQTAQTDRTDVVLLVIIGMVGNGHGK